MHRPTIFGLVAAALTVATPAGAQTFPSSAGPLAVTTFARGLVHPWSLAFLPDGRVLVTERPGRMRIVDNDGKLTPPLAGVPHVVAGGQAGMLDVRLDNDFATNHVIYFCYNVDRGGSNAVARATLDAADKPRLNDVKVIFTQVGPGGSYNNACRIVQAPDGNLIVTLGDHFEPRDQAQNLANDVGKVIRIRPDGQIPDDNPFVHQSGARPEIWAYGVRNAEGLAYEPGTGKLWENENGPQGGDEVNIIDKGKNYGWPVIGFGVDYGGAKIHESTHKAGMEQPQWYWVPSIAPSGMAFYTGDLFPAWRGNIFVGALKFEMLVRLEHDGDKVTKEERLLRGLHERIRDVRMGPDGALWLLTDNPAGRILRVTPAKR